MKKPIHYFDAGRSQIYATQQFGVFGGIISIHELVVLSYYILLINKGCFQLFNEQC